MKKRIPLIGLFVALAFVLSYLEYCIPFSVGIPGVKLGLANLVVIIALFILKPADAFLIQLVRIVLAGFTFGSLSSMFYALVGGIGSYVVMVILLKTKWFSPTGISVAGGVSHNIFQLMVACFALETSQLFYYLPVLLLSGTIAGTLIGLMGSLLIRRLKKIKLFDKV